MECPICFYEYNSKERRPLRTFCICKKTLCLSCIKSLLEFDSFCPWDKTRWTGRNLLKRFYKSTPSDFFIQLRINDKSLKPIECQESDKSYDSIDECLAWSLYHEILREHSENNLMNKEDFCKFDYPKDRPTIQNKNEEDENLQHQIATSKNKSAIFSYFKKKPKVSSHEEKQIFIDLTNSIDCSKRRKVNEDTNTSWQCPKCTFINDLKKYSNCEICKYKKPSRSKISFFIKEN